jgi:hypothetical protein
MVTVMIEERLKKLMSLGWNIMIQCKGKGEAYQLTYEASAKLAIPRKATTEDLYRSMVKIEALGDTLEELITALEKKITKPIKR